MIENIFATIALSCIALFVLCCFGDDGAHRRFFDAAREIVCVVFVFSMIGYGIASVWSL